MNKTFFLKHVHDSVLSYQLSLKTEPLIHHLNAGAVDGRLHTCITQQACPVQLIISRKHWEQIRFHLISSPHAPGHSGLTLAKTSQTSSHLVSW